jgi:hypothetical protein
MPGTPGYFEASSLVERFDATEDLDRASGDIHPLGNPHVQANPHNVAQIAGLGVIAAHSMNWEKDGFEVQITAVNAALIAAIGLNWTEKRWPRQQEALIGSNFRFPNWRDHRLGHSGDSAYHWFVLTEQKQCTVIY